MTVVRGRVTLECLSGGGGGGGGSVTLVWGQKVRVNGGNDRHEGPRFGDVRTKSVIKIRLLYGHFRPCCFQANSGGRFGRL